MVTNDTSKLMVKVSFFRYNLFHICGRARCEILINNLCVAFKSKLIDGRDKQIIGCLEYIREYLMKRIMNVEHVIDKSDGPLTLTATTIFKVIK